MKSTLRPYDAAYLKLPREIDQSVHLEDMIQRQGRWSIVKIGAVVKCSGLLYEVSVPAGEWCVCIGLTRTSRVACGTWLRHDGHGAYELVCGKCVDAERVVGGPGKCITPAEQVPVAKTFIECGDHGVVFTLKEGAESR